LNTIAAGPRTMSQIDEAVKPFLAAETFQSMVDDLVARGWVAGGYELTAEGREVYETIAVKVRAFRKKAIDGLSDQDYITLVTLLERVAANVTATG
jgi:hypothetical protein